MARRGRPPKIGRDSFQTPRQNRPRRTREHIQEELNRLHVQMLAAQCGFVTERTEHDYGYDLLLFTYDEQGEIESGFIYLQLKATDTLERFLLTDGKVISFPIERRHLTLWCKEPMPVILIVYDVMQQQGYWLYVQRYCQTIADEITGEQQNVSLHIPRENRLDETAFPLFRVWKQQVLDRIKELRLHEDHSN